MSANIHPELQLIHIHCRDSGSFFEDILYVQHMCMFASEFKSTCKKPTPTMREGNIIKQKGKAYLEKVIYLCMFDLELDVTISRNYFIQSVHCIFNRGIICLMEFKV